MAKRFDLELRIISDEDDIIISVKGKTYGSIRQLIMIAISDLDKKDVPPLKRMFKSKRVEPPLEPTEEDINDIT